MRDQASDPSHQKQYDDDDQHQSQPTTGCVAPIAAMRPAREGADQHQYQNDQQYGTQSHGFLLSIASEWIQFAGAQAAGGASNGPWGILLNKRP